VRGDGWSARIALAPGDGPAAAADAAAAAIGVAARTAALRARNRVEEMVATATRHAAAQHAAATALAAADRELAERHADHARVADCAAELAARLGDWRLGEPPELAAARDRLAQAQAHLAAVPDEPFAWLRELDPAVAGAMLRDLPADRLDGARPAAGRLARALHGGEPLLAVAATASGLAGVTSERVLVDGAAYEPEAVSVDGDRMLVRGAPEAVADGGEVLATGLAEERAGRLAAALELVRVARRAGPPPPGPAGERDDPLALLARLGELRDRGVIDHAEFEAKKADLLDRI
jgi:hypothetical protein